MKVFLTGATGFLGSHTAEALLSRGHQVTAMVRKSSDLKFLKGLGLNLVTGSLEDCADTIPHLGGADAVVHVGGIVKAKNQKHFDEVNYLGTKNLVEAVLQASPRPKQWIHISTIAVHDPSRGEDFCLPGSRCSPITPYGLSKQRGEVALEALSGKVPAITLRPPVIYGPRDQDLLIMFRAIHKGVVPLFGDGQNRFSVIFVKDAAQAIVQVMERQKTCSDTFCLDDGGIHTWESFAQTALETLNRKAVFLKLPRPVYHLAGFTSELWGKLRQKPVVFTTDKVKEMMQPSWVCGHEKLTQELDWNPQVDLYRGFKETLQYYQAAGLL